MYSTSETAHRNISRLRKMAALYFSFAFILIFANCKVFAESTEQKEACEAVFNGTIVDKDCCESLSWADSGAPTECKDDGDRTCDYYKCQANEIGLIVDDKINDERVVELLNKWEKKSPSEKAAVDRVRRNCSGAKFADLLADSSASDEVCEPLQFYLCLYANALFECTAWKQDAQCTKMKEYTETCKKYIDV